MFLETLIHGVTFCVPFFSKSARIHTLSKDVFQQRKFPGNTLWAAALNRFTAYLYASKELSSKQAYLAQDFVNVCKDASVFQNVYYYELKKNILTDLGFSDLKNSDKSLALSKSSSTFDLQKIKKIHDCLLSEYRKFVRYQERIEETRPDLQKQLTDLKNPIEWYPGARKLRRHIIMHVGPTNSGKTHRALERLKTCKKGIFAGPLRLLAHEIYNRLQANGIACNLYTGEEIRNDYPFPQVVSCTVEMCNLSTTFDVAVIDEIQMMADPSRGYAWTQCLLGLQAKEIHLCGEESVVKLVRSIAKMTQDDFTVYRYERLNPLHVAEKSLNGKLSELKDGDCVVAFSRKNIFTLKSKIDQALGKKSAVIYGSLPPEVRNQQASLFNSKSSDENILLASDAIGMGLNLGVKRIVFSDLKKFSGVSTIDIPVPQIKQIAGRAGRHNPNGSKQSAGIVTTLYQKDFAKLNRAMNLPTKNLFNACIGAKDDLFFRYLSLFSDDIPQKLIFDRYFKLAKTTTPFVVSEGALSTFIIEYLDHIKGLTIKDKIKLLGCPVLKHSKYAPLFIREIGCVIAQGKRLQIYDLKSVPLEILERGIPTTETELQQLEQLHKLIVAYMWASIRYPAILQNGAAEKTKAIAEAFLIKGISKLQK